MKDARTRLQTVYFSRPITHLLLLLYLVKSKETVGNSWTVKRAFSVSVADTDSSAKTQSDLQTGCEVNTDTQPTPPPHPRPPILFWTALRDLNVPHDRGYMEPNIPHTPFSRSNTVACVIMM